MASPARSPRDDHNLAQPPPRKRVMLSLPNNDEDAALRDVESDSTQLEVEHPSGPSHSQMVIPGSEDTNEGTTSSPRRRGAKARRAPKRRRSNLKVEEEEAAKAKEAQDQVKSPTDDPEIIKKEGTPRLPDPEIEDDGVRSSEPLADYSCPICFSPPTNATLTPCGHICCAECLFTAVRAILQRANTRMSPEPPVARCPVCRAVLTGWDGQGGGVIGLNVKTIISL